MKNYISINDKKIELTDDRVEKIIGSFNLPSAKLADVPVGETFKIGSREFVVLEQSGDTTAVILKEFLMKDQAFGDSNNYAGSSADKICCEFAGELEILIGKDNLVQHTVDLTADDGLKDYGSVKRRVSLLTADLYRRYVEVLDKHRPDEWWWLATAFSTHTHGYKTSVMCVAPSGCINGIFNSGYYCSVGVRPFCILKSTIFVSK